jgi:two-component system, LytTR family, response regulator
MNVIIVDDEPNARENLRILLERHIPGLSVKAMAGSVQDAVREVEKHRPDLVFLDIEMPHENGFAFLEKFTDIDFDVIFVTAYDQYAVKAFKFSAADYILKPVDVDELCEAVEKVVSKKQKSGRKNVKTLVENKKLNGTGNKKLVLSLSDQFLFVELKDIIRLEAEDYYTWFYISNRDRILISKNLGEYEELLTEHDFYRVHKSHLINLSHIQKVLKGDGGCVVMTDNSQIPISKVKKNEFMKKISLG